MNENVQQIINRHGSLISDEEHRLFFQPHIPPEKLLNALGAYAKDGTPETVLALYDDTIRKNAKDGAILTTSHLYAHNVMENPVRINLHDIASVSYKEGLNNQLLINGRPFLNISFSRTAMRSFARMLEEIVTVLHSDTDAVAQEEMIAALHQAKEPNTPTEAQEAAAKALPALVHQTTITQPSDSASRVPAQAQSGNEPTETAGCSPQTSLVVGLVLLWLPMLFIINSATSAPAPLLIMAFFIACFGAMMVLSAFGRMGKK